MRASRTTGFAAAFVAFMFSVPCASKCPEAPHAAEARALANEADAIIRVNIDDAISKLETASQMDPTNHLILWKLALAYKKTENWDKVDARLAAACALAPTFARYFALRGFALTQMIAHGHATTVDPKTVLEQAIALDPNDAGAYYDLANVLLGARDIQGALAYFTKAIQVAPARVDDYGALADAYFRLGFFDQAIAVAREGLTWDTDHPRYELLVIWAGALEEQKSIDGAIAKYSDAKKACGGCNEGNERLIYFFLGSAFARATPPRKSEATASLGAFMKLICKGALAQRYADQCQASADLMKQVSAP